jgi:hypothetical protein
VGGLANDFNEPDVADSQPTLKLKIKNYVETLNVSRM